MKEMDINASPAAVEHRDKDARGGASWKAELSGGAGGRHSRTGKRPSGREKQYHWRVITHFPISRVFSPFFLQAHRCCLFPTQRDPDVTSGT